MIRIGRTIVIALFLTGASPDDAFAFVDLPTQAATFPALLTLIIPIVLYETYHFSGSERASRIRIAVGSTITGILTAPAIIVFGRLQMAAGEAVQVWADSFLGVFQFGEPSFVDILYHLTVGSGLLIQRKSFFLANILVIAMSLLPTMLLNLLIGIGILERALQSPRSAVLRRKALQAKAKEYGVLVIVSLCFAARYIFI